jgi:LuxR family maltose regulon positive regulatory protein
MSEPLLFTKLYIPPTRSKVVFRPRLVKRLNEGLSTGCKLTLISAPAGFGKTTLVSEWVADCDRPVAWLSLDEGDNDPTRFLIYLVSALRTIMANIGEGVLRVLQSPQPPSIESILIALLNEIATISDHFVLVLDDYHLIDSKPVDEALTFLLEHLPPQMHLVITTREDPGLPLARLRARSQLTELRAADLRFTSSEATEFLNQVMGLNLSVEDTSILENCRLHSRIRWGPPLHRGLPGRRGHSAPVRTGSKLPAPDRYSRSIEWLAVQCRHWPGGKQLAVGGLGAKQLLCRSAG